MLLTYAQTDTVYLTWRWTDGGPVGAARLHPDVLASVPTLLAATLPDSQPGEGAADAIARASSRWLGSPSGSDQLGDQLADALFPPEVAMLLLGRTPIDGPRPRLVVTPCPALAQVPWALLRVRLTGDGQQRAPLPTIATICGGVPQAVLTAARPGASGSSTVAVLDPRIPGQPANGPLGSVLGRPSADDPLAALLRPGVVPEAASYPELVRRSDLDRDWLRAACAGADRLLFVGHVSGAGLNDATGENSSLHLCCRDETGTHRPLHAVDVATDETWRMPGRVALIGCASGADFRHTEPLGWALASVLAGARIVTAALWTLPTDAALPGQPFRRLVLAVDDAHRSDDPAATLGDWQAEQAHAWRETGDTTHSPLLWASLMTWTADVEEVS